MALAWAVSTLLLTRALRHAGAAAVRDVRLDHLQAAMDKLSADQGRAVQLLADQIRDDRNASNQRLRWLEEHAWKN